MIPPQLTAKLAVFVLSTVTTTVVPVLIQDRPVLKWTWGKLGPVIETRVEDRINDRLLPPEEDQIKLP